jgi:hypothetical protein
MNFDKADGTDIFTGEDESRSGMIAHTILAAGAAQYDSAQTQSGWGNALYLDGSGSYLVINDNSSAWNFVNGSWTIECWVRFAGTGYYSWFSSDDSANNGMALYQHQPINRFYVQSYAASPYWSWTSSPNTWYYVVLQYDDAGYLSLYVNGDRIGYSASSSISPYPNHYIFIGTRHEMDANFNGWIDGYRISKVARYSGATMTVPTAPFSVYLP